MTTRAPLPASNTIARAYYVLAGVYTLAASIIWSINTLFLLRVGQLSLVQVFLANAVFTGSMAVFEVPTGIIADTRGRRLSFLLSVAVLFLGTLAYVAVPRLGGGFVAFCVVSVVLGLGYTFYSGATEAWLVDALEATGHAEPLDRVLARGQIVSSGAMLVGTIAGGFLGNMSLLVPYLIRSGLLVIAFVVAWFTMHELGFSVRPLPLREVPTEMLRVGRESLRFGWRVRQARLAILAGAAPAIFLEWGYHGWQPYLLGLLGSDRIWILGTVAASISLAMIAGNWLVERLTRFCGRRTTLLLGASIVYSISAIGVGLAGTFTAALTLYLIGMMSAGVFQPVRQGYLHLVVAKEQRATVLSLASLVSSGASMTGQAGLGILAGRTSLGAGYIAGGIATALALPAVLLMRKLGGGPDRIVGKAGRYSSCPSLALPEGVAVGAEREVS